MLPVTQAQICFHISASPNDNFYSQIAMFRLALDALGEVYKKAHIILSLGDEEFSPLPDRWKPYLRNTTKLNWVDPQLYQRYSYAAQGNARWKYNYEGYDIVIFCDADTLLVRPIDDVLARIQQSPAVMGVMAHYPFNWNTGDDNDQAWMELARRFLGKPIDLNHKYTLVSDDDPSANCPFYANNGFIVITPKIIKSLANTYLSLRPKIASLKEIKNPAFAGQIALALSLLTLDTPTYELGLRYNFPNDPVADKLHPKELEDVRLIHYLRTDKFDRHAIFATEDAFNDFLSLKLDGSNKFFQDHIRKLTNGRYPFNFETPTLPEKSEQDNMKTGDNKVIVVLGMHRSGTSTVARSLQVLGIGLGENLYPATPENPKGYWEDQDCIAINEELLSHLGADYDRFGLDWDFTPTDQSISHLYERAIRLVSESVAKNRGIWGVKDPRMCRLLGFWKKVFDTCGCSVDYIISIRNPISVAKSLEKRNHLPPEKSYFLWLQHMIPAILGTRKEARTVVDYDLLVDAPEEQIARIADHLKMPFDVKNNDLLMDFSRNFLDNNLRHSTYSLSQSSVDSHLPYDALKAYELLLRVARDEITISSDEVQSSFEQIQSNLKVYSSVFTYTNLFEERGLNNLLSFAKAYVPEIYPELRMRWVSYLITIPESDVERLGLYQGVSEHDRQITDFYQTIPPGKVQLITTLVDRNGEIANLKQAMAERDRQIATLIQTISVLNQVVVNRGGQIDSLNQVVVDRTGQIDSLNQAVVERDGQIANLNQTMAERDKQISLLNQDMAERARLTFNLNEQIAEIYRSKAWRFIQMYRKILSRITRR